MEEILFAAVIMWALGRVAKKKADGPPPGSIDLPPQERTMGNPGNGKRR